MSALHISLVAEPVFHIGSFAVTNSLLNACIAAIILSVGALCLRLTIKPSGVPGHFQNALEGITETLLTYMDRVTGDHRKSVAFLPLIGTLFIFILLSNWMGLFPGTGSILVHNGEEVAPLFRPATADLNLTIALALVAVASSHIMGVVALGWGKHLNKFIQLGTLWQALRTLSPIKILTAVIELGVGFLELVGEFAKLASLSLRLFGNVFAGEVLLTVLASLIAYVLPLPFMLLEILVGLVQASVFAMLTLVYLSVMTKVPHEAH